MEPNAPQTNSQPMPNPAPMSAMPMTPTEHKKVGPIIATLIIVLILIIAALYLFASKINQPTVPSNDTASNDSAVNVDTVKPVTNTSDDPAALQADLNASTNGLDGQNF